MYTYHILLENNVLRGTLHWGQFESIKRRKADNVNTMSYIIFGNYNVVTCSSRSDLEYYIYIISEFILIYLFHLASIRFTTHMCQIGSIYKTEISRPFCKFKWFPNIPDVHHAYNPCRRLWMCKTNLMDTNNKKIVIQIGNP